MPNVINKSNAVNSLALYYAELIIIMNTFISQTIIIIILFKIVVATFTPRRSRISGARFTRSPLLASRLPSGRRSAPWDTAMAGLLLCVDSLLNRCYLLVSGSVRVRVRVSVTARARVSARVTARDRDRV